MAFPDPIRVLIVPGLHDSSPAHWQTWLQRQSRHALRVQQRDWSEPDLECWAERIEATLASQPPARWIAAAHSFGCLALARYLSRRSADRFDTCRTVRAALLVAPADPKRFSIQPLVPATRLPIHSALISSETDPWMSGAESRRWAGLWGARFTSLGDAGHINAEAGFGPFPQAKAAVIGMARRLAGELRIDHAHPAELSYAI
jgi:predicted alpha/beta hydrolase family esterase